MIDHIVGAGHGLPNPNRIRAYTSAGNPTTLDFPGYGAGAWGVNVGGTGAAMAKLNYYAYATLRYGVDIAGGTIDVDAYSEILTTPGPGAVFGPHVRAWNFDGASLSAISKVSFFAYATLEYGANAAAADVDGNGFAEILTAPGPGPSFAPHVRGFDFDGSAVAAIPGCSFFAFAGIVRGAWISGGDVDGDAFGEIVATPGPGASASYPARFLGFKFTGSTIATLPGFDATPLSSRYGGRAAIGDVDLDGAADLVASAGPDPAADSQIRALRYTGTGMAPLPGSFTAFPAYTYGASVASGHLGF